MEGTSRHGAAADGQGAPQSLLPGASHARGAPDMSRPSKVSLGLDPERNGKQIGYLSAPHSRIESGWVAARFPIGVVKNGRGPTVFLTGGNHGDEYEGPIALAKLVQAIDPAEIQGRIIAMPY